MISNRITALICVHSVVAWAVLTAHAVGPLADATSANTRGTAAFSESDATSTIDIEFAVYQPGDFPGPDPSSVAEWVYAFQVFNDKTGTLDISAFGIGVFNAGVISSGSVGSTTDPQVGVPNGVEPGSSSASASGVTWELLNNTLDPPPVSEFSSVLLFTSPQS